MSEGVHYGVVRISGPNGGHARYDIVKHQPGRADHVLAHWALYPDAVVIVTALNSHKGADT